jgi:hypothetical protein
MAQSVFTLSFSQTIISYSLEPLANDTPRSTNTNSPRAETSHGGEARSSQRPTSAGSSLFPLVYSSAKLSMVFVGCTADWLQDTRREAVEGDH